MPGPVPGPNTYPTAQTPSPRPLSSHQGDLTGPQHLCHFPQCPCVLSVSLSHCVSSLPMKQAYLLFPYYFPY